LDSVFLCCDLWYLLRFGQLESNPMYTLPLMVFVHR